MDGLRELLARLRSFFCKQDRDEDIDQELSAHLELALQDYIERGMPPQEARRHALVSIGSLRAFRESLVKQVSRETCSSRDNGSGPRMTSAMTDTR
jgi:hypothetical protein